MLKILNIKIKFLKLSQLFLILLVFVFPFQIQTVIYKNGLLTGIFNPFNSYLLSLSDILIWLIVIFFTLASIFQGNRLKNVGAEFNLLSLAILGFLFFQIVSLFQANDVVLSFLNIIRSMELFALFYLISINLVERQKLLKIFVIRC